MSRLRQRMAEIAAHQESRKAPGEAITNQLEKAGDALELAARVADRGYIARGRKPDESDAFWLGFVTAGKETALMLRAMRAGQPPDPSELKACRDDALAECGNKVKPATCEIAAMTGDDCPICAEHDAKVRDLDEDAAITGVVE